MRTPKKLCHKSRPFSSLRPASQTRLFVYAGSYVPTNRRSCACTTWHGKEHSNPHPIVTNHFFITPRNQKANSSNQKTERIRPPALAICLAAKRNLSKV